MLSRPAPEARDGEEEHEVDRLVKEIEKSQHSERRRLAKVLDEAASETTPIGQSIKLTSSDWFQKGALLAAKLSE